MVEVKVNKKVERELEARNEAELKALAKMPVEQQRELAALRAAITAAAGREAVKSLSLAEGKVKVKEVPEIAKPKPKKLFGKPVPTRLVVKEIAKVPRGGLVARSGRVTRQHKGHTVG